MRLHRAVESGYVVRDLRQLLVIVLCLLVPGSASTTVAGVVGTATLVKNPAAGNNFNAPDAALPPGFVAYQLCLCGTNGDVISAVDVSITGGALHQRWNDTDFDGVTNPSPTGNASNGRGDSHLTPPPGSPFGGGPVETNSKTGSPLPSVAGVTEYGFGNLAGAWAILTPTYLNKIAYIVFRADVVPNLNIEIKSATPTGTALPTLFTADFGPYCLPIPEPTSLAQLGLVSLAALGFRRVGPRPA
jgi:hypothetical protein